MSTSFKLLFALLVQALTFTITYTSSATAFSDADLKNILLLGGAVNALFLLGVLFFLGFRFMANAITLSTLVLSGIMTSLIIHTDLYLVQNRTVLILLCTAAGVALSVAFRVFDEVRWGGVAILEATLVGLCIIIGGHLLSGKGTVEGDVTNLREVSFRKTPNLYFVSFDAMAPQVLLDKYLKLGATRFHDWFEKKFRRFPNFFSNAPNTTHSLNLLLALDPSVYGGQLKVLEERGDEGNAFLFSGQNPSPLLGILRKSGYETTSIYGDTFLGDKKGPYIDNFITYRNSTVCNLLDAKIRNVAFWMYCSFIDLTDRFGQGSDVTDLMTVEQITKTDTDGTPQFVIAHIYTPGHTDKSFRYDVSESLEKYKARYLKEVNGRALSYLETIVRHLERNDPDAIFFVYGDHGPFLSQGLSFADNREFVIQDHYGVLGGIYPRDACAAWFDDALSQGYLTILDAVHTILRCLSDGESVYLSDPPKYRILNWQALPLGSEGVLDYKEFIYE